jgi:hypothetical protein
MKCLVLLPSALLAGCACGQMGQPACQSIRVTGNPNYLTINGSSFSNITNCTHLSMAGSLPPEAIIINRQSAMLERIVSKLQLAILLRGLFAVHFGQIDQTACPSGCVSGVDSGGTCVACGGEGQPVCTGNVCATAMPDLHPKMQVGELIGTASCGRALGAPCASNDPGCGGSRLFFNFRKARA